MMSSLQGPRYIYLGPWTPYTKTVLGEETLSRENDEVRREWNAKKMKISNAGGG
jgi:hypothetical protein